MLSAGRPAVVVRRKRLLPGQRGGRRPPGYRPGS